MAGRHVGAVFSGMEQLFSAGSVAGLSESQLLERFTASGDAAAFEAIVARHGPMVLGICRRVLRDPHDVEDAFQATFLVLVRKAGSLHRRDLLGNWLFGVASRTALRARAVAARRRAAEGAGAETAIEPAASERGSDSASDREASAVLHEELGRLPAKYRTPVLLCYLESLSHEEAARQLGWPLGTVKGRLARARALLHRRLSRRGVVLPASAVAAAVSAQAEGAVPAALVDATVRTAVAVVTGRALAAGVVAANVAALMKGASHAMSLHALKPMVMVLVAGVLATGAGVWAFQHPSPPRPGQPAKKAPAPPPGPAPGPAAAVERTGREAIAVLAPTVAAQDRNPATRTVLARLEEPISMSFANETPLEDVLKYIKAATEGPNDTGIPIYVDPVGLNEEEKTMTSPVTLDLDGVPLKTTLRLLLKQLGLAYCVKDGMLIISSVDGVLQELKEAEAGAAAPRVELPARPSAAAPKAKAAEAAQPPEPPAEGPEPPRETPQPAPGPAPASHPASARSMKVAEALDKPVKLSIAGDTSLRDAFQSLQKAAEVSSGIAIPFYFDGDLDQVKLSEEFDAEGVPLRTVLSLLLSRIGLQWDILDGLVIVSNQPRLANYRRIASHFRTDGSYRDGMTPIRLSNEMEVRLQTPVTLAFPQPTPLEEVLKSIRSATQGNGHTGISVFYGPRAEVLTEDILRRNERGEGVDPERKKIGSLPVQIEVNDVPLRTCLALLLGRQPPYVRTEKSANFAWPPLDGRIIDDVLVVGTQDWLQSIPFPQGALGGGMGMMGGMGGGMR